MSKALSNVMTVFKVARIVAKVILILCIVGSAGCVLGLVLLPLADVLLRTDIFAKQGINLATAYGDCIIGAVTCAGEAIFAFLAYRYFENVEKAGTPFTYDGSKEVFRLGLASLIIAVATSVAAGIVSFVIMLLTSPEAFEPNIGIEFSLTTGLFFMFLSMIFKYGAELQEAKSEDAKQEDKTAEQ